MTEPTDPPEAPGTQWSRALWRHGQRPGGQWPGTAVERVAAQLPQRRPRPGPGLPAVASSTVQAVSRTTRQAGALARRPRPGPGLLRAAPNVARVAAESAWQVASWSLGATIASANFVTRRALEGDSPSAIMQDAAHELRRAAWRALGVDDDTVSELSADEPEAQRPSPNRGQTPAELQRRGTDLLRRSNDVHVVEDTHPAFSRILTEITPDEARILRYLYLEGPQPAVDVRTFRPFGIGSVLIASGLNMIAENAGCRNIDRSDPYMTNLARLGLLEFSREQVSNPARYQVVEVQPKIGEALKRAGRMPKVVHRSVLLTSFGEEFVRTCLPLNGRVAPYRMRTLAAADPDSPGKG